MFRSTLFPLSGMLIACASVANLFSVRHEQVSEFMGLQALANLFLIIISYSAMRSTTGLNGSFSDLVRVRSKIVAFQVVFLALACSFLEVSYIVFVGAVVILAAEILSPCQYFIVNHKHDELTREQVVRALLLLSNAVVIYFLLKPVSAGYILFSNGLLTFISYTISLRSEKITLRWLRTMEPTSTTVPLRVWTVLRGNALVFLFRIIDMCTIWAVHMHVFKAASGDLVQYRLQTLSVSLICQVFVLRRLKHTLETKVLFGAAIAITACSIVCFIVIQISSELIQMNFPIIGDKFMSLLLGLIAWLTTLGYILAPHIYKRTTELAPRR